jgi:Rieske Fe-S protein
MKINDSYLARRRFLCGMLGGGAAALGTGVGLPLVAYVGNLQEAPLPEWLEIEKADYQLPPGTSRIVMYGPIPALLIQTPAPRSELKVFDAVCTHFDCTVSYKPEENRIYCACHEGYYDLDGNVISGPPPRPLHEFHKRVRDDGKLVIALEKDNLEKAFQDP